MIFRLGWLVALLFHAVQAEPAPSRPDTWWCEQRVTHERLYGDEWEMYEPAPGYWAWGSEMIGGTPCRPAGSDLQGEPFDTPEPDPEPPSTTTPPVELPPAPTSPPTTIDSCSIVPCSTPSTEPVPVEGPAEGDVPAARGVQTDVDAEP